MTDSALLSASPADLMIGQFQENARENQKMARLQSLASDPQRMAKINETAQEFESVFLSQMLQHMFAGLEVDEWFGGGDGEEMFKSLLVDEYGKLMAKAGGIGVADHIRQEMLRLQEVN